MKLGMQLGLGPGHIASDGDPATLPQRGTVPPIFGPYLLRPNGWMDQDTTWYGGTPQPRDIVLDGDPALLHKKRAEPPIFGPCILWPNGWIDQDGTWYGDRPHPRQLCVR